MSGYLATSWADFSVAVVGASAALTGLLFVAVSINIERILATGTLAGRTLSTLLLFIVPLVVGILILVPEQSSTALGLELIVTGVVAGGGLLRINRPASRGELEPRWSWVLIRLGPSMAITVLPVVAGTSLLAHAGGGLYWVAPAMVAAFLGGLGTVWVLLVEIRR
jgi:modulator of FtsH protease